MTSPAVQLATLTALLAASPPTGGGDAYDGPIPEVEYLTDREADIRAGYHYPEGP